MRYAVSALLLLGCSSIVVGDSRLAMVPRFATDAKDLVGWIRRLEFRHSFYDEQIDWNGYYRSRGYPRPAPVWINKLCDRWHIAKTERGNRARAGLLHNNTGEIVSPVLWQFNADDMGRQEILWPVTMDVRGLGLRR